VGVNAPGRHKATWTSADAVRAFACGYGIPMALGQDYVDPASNRLGSIYGEMVALRLNREFSCQGYFTEFSKCFGTAVVPPEVLKFAGLTVDQLLAVADQALGGNADALLPYGNSLFRLQSALAYMNQLYDDCGGLVSDDRLQQKFDDELPGGTANPLPSQVLVTSHPNPLETSVTISLALPAAGNVSMEIYDVQGRSVVTMASRPMSEGRHDVTWDGADKAGAPVAAGVYFLRVQVDGQTAVMHKMTKL
ncbi:MAG: FlgD immunoglobulin-like domain containing protein, partial [bacterium]